MIELILDNLGIVLFVVIAIAARVLQARFRARQKEAPPPFFASGLEPDDDDGGDGARYRLEPDENEAFIDYARTRGASAHAVEKTRFLQERLVEASRFEAFSGKTADEPLVPASRPAAVSAAPGEKNQISAPALETQKPPNRFPWPERLSPLQKAMVWVEILGKPKGMV
jgi:hypothetical protein